jgi:hypothetical protein
MCRTVGSDVRSVQIFDSLFKAFADPLKVEVPLEGCPLPIDVLQPLKVVPGVPIRDTISPLNSCVTKYPPGLSLPGKMPVECYDRSPSSSSRSTEASDCTLSPMSSCQSTDTEFEDLQASTTTLKSPTLKRQPTTMILQNIPNRMKQQALWNEIEMRGLSESIDLFYLPIDPKSGCNLGYAFINCVTPADANCFSDVFTGVKLSQQSKKVCGVSPSRIQGRDANIRALPRVNTLPEAHRPIVRGILESALV